MENHQRRIKKECRRWALQREPSLLSAHAQTVPPQQRRTNTARQTHVQTVLGPEEKNVSEDHSR